tara:strand:+ start:33 stop:926 length:894 start_codon:yes stop_codon:yes gene_type:complete
MILSMSNLNSLRKNIVILGASGWIGKNFVNSLNKIPNANLFLYSFQNQKTIELDKDLVYKTQPIANINKLNIDRVDSLIDLAFPTQDKINKLGDLNYTQQVEELLSIKKEFLCQYQPLTIFNTSSGAVHWQGKEINLYSIKKLEEEELYIDYCKKSNTNLDIARVFGFLGKFYNFNNDYAFTSFIKQAKTNKKITIKSSNFVYRSYILFENLFSYYKYRTFNHTGSEINVFDACLNTFEIGYLASLIAEKFSATVDRKENPEGSDSYTGDCDFLTNFLKSKNLDWQITDKKILNLIE